MEARWTRWAIRLPGEPARCGLQLGFRVFLVMLASENDRSGSVDVDSSLTTSQLSPGFKARLASRGRRDGRTDSFAGLERNADRADRVVVAGPPDDGPVSPRQPLSDAAEVGTGIHLDL